MEPGEIRRCDLAIVGGGMVGLSLAAALQGLPLDVVVIEPVSPESPDQPSFDERTTALSNGSRRILEGIGAWPAVDRHATPILGIHVSDRGRFGTARLTAAEQGVPALGHTLTNRLLGEALRDCCARGGRTTLLCPASVESVDPSDRTVSLQVRGAWQGRVEARLVVAADGAQSLVRRELGIGAAVSDYRQVAVIASLKPGRAHAHVAYERFTPDGPIAILPLAGGRCTAVWTLDPATAERVMAMDDQEFLAALQQAFGFRLGRLAEPGRRFAYPLSLTRAERQAGPRSVMIGNAAQGLHPVAGQGFNLGLRDVAVLAEVLADELAAAGSAFDPGQAALLERFERWREEDRGRVIGFTDGLVRLFASRLPAIGLARDVGMVLFDLMTPAKHAFARVTMGLTGRGARLARGLPL